MLYMQNEAIFSYVQRQLNITGITHSILQMDLKVHLQSGLSLASFWTAIPPSLAFLYNKSGKVKLYPQLPSSLWLLCVLFLANEIRCLSLWSPTHTLQLQSPTPGPWTGTGQWAGTDPWPVRNRAT